MKRYKAAAYMRLSVAGRSETESESIANQEYCIRRFVDEQPDIEIVSCRIDDGYSGLIFQRPSFCAMLQDATDGQINCIIVRDLSRFGREFVETGRYLRNILPAYGIRFIAISDGIDTNRISAKDDLLMQIKSAINDEFSRDISMKTRRALSTMRKNGLYVGACPVYGYLKSNEDKHQLVIDEYAANIVRDIFEMKISGASAAVIAKELNDRNVLSPLEYKKSKGLPYSKNGFTDKSNSRWSASTIIRILKDETYIGTLVQGKQYSINYKVKKQVTKPVDEWVQMEMSHEAIVPYYDFQTIQRLMLLDTRISSGMGKVNLFSGLLICDYCDAGMTRKTTARSGKRYHYYYCCAGKKNGCHSPAFIEEGALEAHVFKGIESYIKEVESLVRRSSQMNKDEVNQELTSGITAQIKKLQNDLDEAQFFTSKLRTTLLNGIISEEDYAWMKADYAAKIFSLKNEIDLLVRETQTIIMRREERVQWLFNISEFAEATTFDRAMIVRLVKNICVRSKNNIVVDFVYAIE